MGNEMLRCAQHDKATVCHPERGDGSGSMGDEMLRCAQHDRTGFGR